MSHKELLEPIRRYCLERIEPTAAEDDQNSRFRMELYKGLTALGATAITIPETEGGLGLSSQVGADTLIEIARTSVAYAVSLSVTGLVQTAILNFGTPDQKKKYLPLLTSGEWIASFALTEPTSGSDAAALKTRASLSADHYILNGAKQFCTSGNLAKLVLVFAKTAENEISAFLVETPTPGFSVGKMEKKMGWRASPTTGLNFEDCHIPRSQILGKPGDGFKVAMSTLDAGRINISAIALGLASRAFEEARAYACERKQFGKPIIEFQGIGFMLADMYSSIEAGLALLHKVCTLKDAKYTLTAQASALKVFTTDTAMKVTTDAVQVFGGYGYCEEYPVERYMRDAKVFQIVEGSNQIQRVVISRHLEKGPVL